MNSRVALIIAGGLTIGTGSVILLVKAIWAAHKAKRSVGSLPLVLIWGSLACIGFSCAWLPVVFYNLGGPTPETGAAKAAELIQALESHKTQTGSYPQSLESLVPGYLVAIPAPGWNSHYAYRTSPSESNRLEYVLKFHIGGSADDWYCYKSSSRIWKRYDSYC